MTLFPQSPCASPGLASSESVSLYFTISVSVCEFKLAARRLVARLQARGEDRLGDRPSILGRDTLSETPECSGIVSSNAKLVIQAGTNLIGPPAILGEDRIDGKNERNLA